MVRAQLDIVMRNGTSITVGFPDDEAVNAVSEKLKKAILDVNGIFSIDMKAQETGANIVHYIPSREIVRFSLTQFPRVAAPV